MLSWIFALKIVQIRSEVNFDDFVGLLDKSASGSLKFVKGGLGHEILSNFGHELGHIPKPRTRVRTRTWVRTRTSDSDKGSDMSSDTGSDVSSDLYSDGFGLGHGFGHGFGLGNDFGHACPTISGHKGADWSRKSEHYR